MSSEVIAGLAKGLLILELYGSGVERLTVSDAARGADLSPASARRCLRTLAVAGYLSFDGKYYSPTPRLLRLSAAYLATSEIASLAKPRVAAARDALDESVSLSVRDGSEVVFVARAEVRRIVSAGVHVGARLPLVVSASGQLFLADLTRNETDELHAAYVSKEPTLKAPWSIETLHQRLEHVRNQGFAYTDGDLEPGMRTLAVPVRDFHGVLHAALTVSVFSSRVSMDTLVTDFYETLRREANILGNAL